MTQHWVRSSTGYAVVNSGICITVIIDAYASLFVAGRYAGRAKDLGAELVFMMGVIEPTHWDVDAAKFPNGVTKHNLAYEML